jgi:UDP-N-acetylglucosamine 2-epimerase (non-hydrolysing)
LKGKYKLILVAGARPNFMKIAPIIRELKARSSKLKGEKELEYKLVHIGQHYDEEMSELFFRQLDIPELDILPISAQSTFR